MELILNIAILLVTILSLVIIAKNNAALRKQYKDYTINLPTATLIKQCAMLTQMMTKLENECEETKKRAKVVMDDSCKRRIKAEKECSELRTEKNNLLICIIDLLSRIPSSAARYYVKKDYGSLKKGCIIEYEKLPTEIPVKQNANIPPIMNFMYGNKGYKIIAGPTPEDTDEEHTIFLISDDIIRDLEYFEKFENLNIKKHADKS